MPRERTTNGRPPGKTTLRGTGLTKSYGRRTVVGHVDLQIDNGEVVGLLGPNGAG